jgi:hypothetical protein
MAQLSTSRRRGFRWGWLSAAAAHASGNMVRKSRTVNALGSAARVTLRSVTRVGHVLWLEVTGLFFVAFGVIGSLAAWHEYSKHRIVTGRFAAAVCFMVLFAWFGLSSFYRARRKA